MEDATAARSPASASQGFLACRRLIVAVVGLLRAIGHEQSDPGADRVWHPVDALWLERSRQIRAGIDVWR